MNHTSLLNEALQHFTQALNWFESKQVVELFPVLLSDEADDWFLRLSEFARTEADEESATAFEEQRLLLQRCRQVGITQAFFEKIALDSQPLEPLLASHMVTVAEKLMQSVFKGNYADRFQICIAGLNLIAREESSVLWATLHNEAGVALAQNMSILRIEALEQAITHFKAALTVRTPQSYPLAWAVTIVNLATAYMERVQGAHVSNIEKSIELLESALAVLTARVDPLLWAQTVGNLANAYVQRVNGERFKNIERALALYEESLPILKSRSPQNWAWNLINLGNLYAQNSFKGRVPDIEQALVCYHTALPILQAEPRRWALVNNNIANVLRERILTERADNIETALHHYKVALGVIDKMNMPELWGIISANMGGAYLNRMVGTRRQNLEIAIALYNDAIPLLERGDPAAQGRLKANLGNAFAERKEGDIAVNLERAIDYYQDARKLLSPESYPVEWAQVTNNLALTYRIRIEGNRKENLAVALLYHREAEGILTPNIYPLSWAQTMNGLGNLYVEMSKDNENDALSNAIKCYKAALSVLHPEQSPAACRQIAQNLGSIFFENERWLEAWHCLQIAIDATETLYQVSLSQMGREAEIEEAKGIYREAAYAAARSGNVETAVLLIERGCARGLGERLKRDRANLENLITTAPVLYKAYHETTTQLRYLEREERNQTLTVGYEVPRLLDVRQTHEQTVRSLNDIISRIRRIPGYNNFLQRPNFREISSVVTPDKPLVYLIPTVRGGVALILWRNRKRSGKRITVDTLWFRELTNQWLYKYLKLWTDSYEKTQSAPQTPLLQLDWHNTIHQVTNALWHCGIGRLVTYLRDLQAATVIVVPTGLLGLLPLHAAWTDEANVFGFADDNVAFSYSPSARALGTVYELAARCQTDQLVVVDEPRPSISTPLSYSAVEVDSIARYFSSTRWLRREAATRASVLESLSQAHILHLSCHGFSDGENVLQSGVLLAHDNVLTTQDLFNQHLPGGRLATLSACESGIIAIRLSDEILSLPTAFLQAGFAGVVATLWSVNQVSTAMLMERFYYLWRCQGLTPSLALRDAQKWMRDTTNQQKADYYERSLAGPGDEDIIDGIASLYEFVAQRVPDERSFQHPVWWAAFYLTGV